MEHCVSDVATSTRFETCLEFLSLKLKKRY